MTFDHYYYYYYYRYYDSFYYYFFNEDPLTDIEKTLEDYATALYVFGSLFVLLFSIGLCICAFIGYRLTSPKIEQAEVV